MELAVVELHGDGMMTVLIDSPYETSQIET